jgi:hypothetical protein
MMVPRRKGVVDPRGTTLSYFGARPEWLSCQKSPGARTNRILDASIQYCATASEWDAEEVS